MTKTDILKEVKTIIAQSDDFLKPMIQKLCQEILEAEIVQNNPKTKANP